MGHTTTTESKPAHDTMDHLLRSDTVPGGLGAARRSIAVNHYDARSKRLACLARSQSRTLNMKRRTQRRTVNMARLSKRALWLARLAVRASDLSLAQTTRPKTRADCENGARPCPFVSCPHHLYLDVNPKTGALKINFPGSDLERLPETCCLDVAARGGSTLQEIAELFGLTRERIRQVEAKALKFLRKDPRCPSLFRDLISADVTPHYTTPGESAESVDALLPLHEIPATDMDPMSDPQRRGGARGR